MKNDTQHLSVLVLGGCHVYGYGIPFGKGFVQRSLHDLEEVGYIVQADYYAPCKLDHVLRMQEQNPTIFAGYDLILVQLGHFELLSRSVFHLFSQNLNVNATVCVNKADCRKDCLMPVDIRRFHQCLDSKGGNLPINTITLSWSGFRQLGRRILVATGLPLTSFPYLRALKGRLWEIMRQLEPWQSRVIVVAPLLSRDPLTNLLRKWGIRQWMKATAWFGLSCINLGPALGGIDDVFLPDGYHLNEQGHDWLYQALRRELADKLAERRMAKSNSTTA